MTLTQARLKELLHYDPDTGIFTRKVSTSPNARAGDVAGTQVEYARISVDGKPYLTHRLAWLYMCGVWPVGDLDHRDEDPANNRIANLREATRSQNEQNSSKPQSNGSSGYLGVSYHRGSGKWGAYICIDGKQRCLGYSSTPEEASEVYIAAKKKFHPFWAEGLTSGQTESTV